ncbi:MAG: M18 family aminopeptidase [Pseudohongiellaceae bacterium]
MNQEALNTGLMQFVQASPTPYHAVANLAAALAAAGFERLEESGQWQLDRNSSYYVTRAQSSIIAFRTGQDDLAESGFHMVGAHTDSPCLKVKPQPEILRQQYIQLGVEVYGGVLLNPWFDRDLSLAGRVDYRDKDGKLGFTLIDFRKAIAIIPSLAIHLDREANERRAINAQTYLPPILAQSGEGKFVFKDFLQQYLAEELGLTVDKVLSFDLRFYDVQPPALVGLHDEFIACARLDNLLSCYVGMQSLIDCTADHGSLVVCTDHEEVGSVSASGAKGPFLEAVLDRIGEAFGTAGAEAKRRTLDRSTFYSVDNSHGIHPNFADKHDDKHGPLLNQGPVIKINGNQRYATSSETSAAFRQLCEVNNVPVQAFVVRNDMACGSTIGPIVAGELGVKTLDLGVPTFGMHSIRETAGSQDAAYLATALTAFFNR